MQLYFLRSKIMRRLAFPFLLLLLLPPSLLRAAPDVSFADLAAGRAAIVDDPAYFDHLQPMEMEAKTGRPLPAAPLAQQRAECRRRYQAAVREFTRDEKTAIRSLVALLDPAVRKNYPQFADTPWNFLKVQAISRPGSRTPAANTSFSPRASVAGSLPTAPV